MTVAPALMRMMVLCGSLHSGVPAGGLVQTHAHCSSLSVTRERLDAVFRDIAASLFSQAYRVYPYQFPLIYHPVSQCEACALYGRS